MRIEVVYALADVQHCVILDMPVGADVYQAVAASGLLARHGVGAAQLQLGISGRKRSPESRLRDGDRVEILRPLAMDPNEARRRRARKRR